MTDNWPVDDGSDSTPPTPRGATLDCRVYPEDDPEELTIYDSTDEMELMTRWITIDIGHSITVANYR